MALFELMFLNDAFDSRGKPQKKENAQEHRASGYSNVQTILYLTAHKHYRQR